MAGNRFLFSGFLIPHPLRPVRRVSSSRVHEAGSRKAALPVPSQEESHRVSQRGRQTPNLTYPVTTAFPPLAQPELPQPELQVYFPPELPGSQLPELPGSQLPG